MYCVNISPQTGRGLIDCRICRLMAHLSPPPEYYYRNVVCLLALLLFGDVRVLLFVVLLADKLTR